MCGKCRKSRQMLEHTGGTFLGYFAQLRLILALAISELFEYFELVCAR